MCCLDRAAMERGSRHAIPRPGPHPVRATTPPPAPAHRPRPPCSHTVASPARCLESRLAHAAGLHARRGDSPRGVAGPDAGSAWGSGLGDEGAGRAQETKIARDILGQLGPGFTRAARPVTGPSAPSLSPWTPPEHGPAAADGGLGWTGRRSVWCRTPRNYVTLAEWRGGQYNKFL
jgi:hypothetical protein